MTNAPTLSPLDAATRCLTEDGFTHDGFTYTLDGAQNTPFELLAPTASQGDKVWFCSGDEEEAITSATLWGDCESML